MNEITSARATLGSAACLIRVNTFLPAAHALVGLGYRDFKEPSRYCRSVGWFADVVMDMICEAGRKAIAEMIHDTAGHKTLLTDTQRSTVDPLEGG
jgi:hypothetical protein